MPEKLTVLIPCKNERKNLRACVEAARPLAHEILVADSGSTDGTLDIARELGCRVIEREYVHSGDFKNWAIPQASHPWVLIIDADERVTPELRDEIARELENPRHSGYWIRRKDYFFGHRVYYSGWQNDRCLRLFRRDVGRYMGDTDHAEVELAVGTVGALGAKLEHFTYWNYDQYLRKLDRYTWRQAKVWHEQGRKPSRLKLLLSAPLRFLQIYFLRGGFVDGAPGLQISLLTAFTSFLKQARLWELHHAKPQPDAEAEHAAAKQSAAQGDSAAVGSARADSAARDAGDSPRRAA